MASLSAREQAYQTIRSRIITMELKPGDPLNDRELAEQMGISRTPMREALIMLNIAHMVDIKPQSGTHVAPIDLKRMELEQFARFTLEKEILNRVRGRLTDQQEQEYRQIIENYRLLEADLTQPNRETRLLELDNQFHRKAFEITGMEAHFDHMLGELQHVERIRKFSLQTNENKSVCAAHTRILEMVLHGTADELGEALESHLNRYRPAASTRSISPRGEKKLFKYGSKTPAGVLEPHLFIQCKKPAGRAVHRCLSAGFLLSSGGKD